ncbi:MAG TPA: hypothetical protein PK992_11715 [Planctomycetaceae bacterium]|nr:hypothetical protein [Planctomycetaceae bacterium]
MARAEPQPPRHFDSDLPDVLENVCLKAIARVASDRYPTARVMADELLAFLSSPSPSPTKIAGPAPSLERERRQVTVITCNLAESSSLSEDPEDLVPSFPNNSPSSSA